jgi:hypothetical protein
VSTVYAAALVQMGGLEPAMQSLPIYKKSRLFTLLPGSTNGGHKNP